MAIQGFEYKEFAQNLAEQARGLIPPDFDELQTNYVMGTLYNFSALAGEALYSDTEANFTLDQAIMITQIIAEWSYHKSVDLVRSGIPQQFWDPVMQKIAFTIFEIAKQTFKQELPQDQILQLIEHHVKKTYLEAIAELKDKGFIDDGLMEEASKQSNIDQMMQQMQEEAETVAATMPDAPAQSMSQQVAQASEPNLPQAQPQGGVPGKLQRYQPPKLLKLVTLALVLKRVKDEKVQTILENFDDEDAGTVLRYMNVSDLENKIDPSIAMKCLKEIKASLPRTKDVSPSKIVEKLQNVSQYLERDQLEKLVQLERPFVKRLVFNALEGEYYEMPPKVANVVASFIEDSV